MGKEPKPQERLQRMRAMFLEGRAILAEDYKHFAGVSQPGASTRQNRGRGKLAGPTVRQGQE